MSTQNSGRSVKSLSGNGIEPPHMQSSLSPQGFGLYNSFLHGGGGGDADSIVDSTSITSGSSPLKKQTISYNDYLTSHPQRNSSNISAAMQDPYWNVTGNENLTERAPKSAYIGDGVGGTYINSTTAPSFDSKPFGSFSNGSNSIIDAKALEKSQQQYQLQEQQRQQYFHTGNNSIARKTATSSALGSSLKVEDGGLDRDREKDRLIDSLSNSDMITCLPGFKKSFVTGRRPNLPQISSNGKTKFNSEVSHRLAQQDMNQNTFLSSSGPQVTVRGPTVSSSSYARQTPATISSVIHYPKNCSSIDGTSAPVGPISRSPANGNSNTLNNSARTVTNSNRYNPPASPITRAKQAIGRAQSEVSKIDKFMENEADKRKPPGAWKNMGTPLFSEPQTKSAQRQQKAQYRMDLERQIMATKKRKAEEERKEKDANVHPLGPEYAHPALTYYNPPQKIVGGDKGGTSSTATKTAALTKYIKEKYALDIPGSGGGGGGGNTIASYTSGYPQEIGVGGSTTALGRIAPLQQTKKEQALANLMKSRMHPGGTGNGGDQNHVNTSRCMPMNQLQTGGTQFYNGMMMQPGNSSNFSQQLHQQQHQQGQQQLGNQQVKVMVEHANPNSSTQQHQGYVSQQQNQFAYPPGAYAPRPYGVNASTTAWPMPMYSAAAAYHYPPQYYGAYGQPMYPSANHGSVNSQQVQQYQNQPPLHYQSSAGIPPPLTRPSPPATLRSILHDRHADEEDGDDMDDDPGPGMDFETLKERAHKAQKIWQTSDELPDPGLRLAVYKVELRKQIDEDRKRKAERLAREKEEDERIERKIREFHEEEKRRLRIEQHTRAELEGYHRHKIEQKQRKKNEAFTVSKHHERMVNETRPRSRSSLLAEKLATFGSPETGDFEEEFYDVDVNDNGYGYEYPEKGYQPTLEAKLERTRSVRKSSPPVPVVQKKLIENYFLEDCNQNSNPRQSISSEGQNFLFQLKSKLRSERDLVERRLQEKIESTHKNMNLLKYTM